MWTIKQPSKIIFGKNSTRQYDFPTNTLVITSKGAKSRGWLDYAKLNKYYVFDQVEPNPAIKTVNKIISEFKDCSIDNIVGIGGGSVLDVSKFSAFKMNKFKIMIPTTFGSGSEVTRISVLKVNGKKKSFHNDGIIADVAIIDSYFLYNSSQSVIRNSVVDALAQCSEAHDSLNSNPYTTFLCEKAFNLLEEGILNNDYEKIVVGSLLDGLGFGNSSTTLGHALSYVYSNEGISHGHALAFCTLVAHEFNNSKFYNRFLKLMKKLDCQKISLKQNLEEAAELILADRKHLDNNPKKVTKDDLIDLLKIINSE